MTLREMAVAQFETAQPTWVDETLKRLGAWGLKSQFPFKVEKDCQALTHDGLMFQLVDGANCRIGPHSLQVTELDEDGESSDLGVISSLWELGEALS